MGLKPGWKGEVASHEWCELAKMKGKTNGNAVVYFEISSTDYKKLESFYSDIFDWMMTHFGD
jgi:hypothetical protein